MLEHAIPIDTNRIDALTKTLASLSKFSAKLFPKNRWTPLGTPTTAIATTIAESEIIVEDVPMISGVVIFDKINQKKYPKNTPAIESIKR